MLPVEIIFRIIFCAVPAFNLVEPVNISGPVTGSMDTFASFPITESLLHAIAAVLHPMLDAYFNPYKT